MRAQETGRARHEDLFIGKSLIHTVKIVTLQALGGTRYHKSVKNPRLLWLVLVFAVLLRLPLLNGSFWLDEAAQALESVRPLSEQLNIVADFQPPLMHYLVHFASYLSIDEWWLRLWGALIPGIVTIWATYQLGKKWFNQRVGLIASLLLATSSLHIFYSQELRPYSLAVMWAMLGTLLLFSKRFEWWKFALISLLGLYTSYLYPFFLLPQLWFIWQMKWGWQRVLKIVVTLAVLFAPLLPTFMAQLAAGQNLRTELPGWERVVSIPQLKALALVPLKFTYGVLNIEPTAFFIIISLALLFVVSFSWRKMPLKNTSLQAAAILFFTPFLASWLVSFLVPVVQPKRLLFLLPFFYLLSVSYLAVKKNIPKSAWLLPIFLLALNLYGTFQYWLQPTLQRENWRSLKQEIIRKYPTPDAIAVFSFDEPFAPWRWYWPDSIPTLSTGERQISAVEDLNDVLKPITNYRYVLVFDYLRDLTDPEDQLIQAVESFDFVGSGVIDYPGIGFVRVYTKVENTIGYKR